MALTEVNGKRFVFLGTRLQPQIVGDIAFVGLTNGRVAKVDAADLHLVAGRNWSAHVDSKGYCYARAHVIDTGQYGPKDKMHRVILGAVRGQIVDHINGDGLDNRRANLRICTTAENIRNSRKHADSKVSQFKGVTRGHRGKFRAQITLNRKKYNLGDYSTQEAAAMAYDAAARKHFGEFGRTNFSLSGFCPSTVAEIRDSGGTLESRQAERSLPETLGNERDVEKKLEARRRFERLNKGFADL